MKQQVVRILLKLFRILLAILAVAVCCLVVLFFRVSSPPEWKNQDENVVNDVTGLNAIRVNKIHQPRTITEISDLVKNFEGPISVGGARHSMGGQIGTDS